MAGRGMFAFQGPEWYSQVDEEILEPELAIVDPHHHLWSLPDSEYLLADLWADTGSGHRVEQPVFVAVSYTHLPLPTTPYV